MEPGQIVAMVLVMGVAVGTTLLSVLRERQDERRRTTVWTKALREARLEHVQQQRGGLTARAGALQVRLTAYSEQKVSGTRIEVFAPGLSPGLVIRRAGSTILGLETGFRDRRDVLLGDDAFDRTVTVRGPETLALALLDSDTRRGVASLIAGRLDLPGHPPLWVSGRVAWGVLRLDLADAVLQLRRVSGTDELPRAGDVYLDGEYQLPAVLLAAVDLGGRLQAPLDLAGRLAANLTSEREAGVRRKLLGTLLREFPESAATEGAVRASCHDPDAEVRVRAAIAIGKQGRSVLLGVASGEGAPDETAARALAALGHSLTLAEAKDLLRSALRTRRLLAAKACLEIIGRIGGGTAEAIQVLGRVLLVEANELGEAAAAALAATHDPAAEAPLLRALADGPVGRRRAAATALGRIGTREAVQPLRDAERDSELRATARQAIAEIHARLAGAGQGQLSLADGGPGRLSLAEGEAGRLSLSDEKPNSRVT